MNNADNISTLRFRGDFLSEKIFIDCINCININVNASYLNDLFKRLAKCFYSIFCFIMIRFNNSKDIVKRTRLIDLKFRDVRRLKSNFTLPKGIIVKL